MLHSWSLGLLLMSFQIDELSNIDGNISEIRVFVFHLFVDHACSTVE
jgi:hypothetical protein